MYKYIPGSSNCSKFVFIPDKNLPKGRHFYRIWKIQVFTRSAYFFELNVASGSYRIPPKTEKNTQRNYISSNPS